jgi:hypothetical protein
MSFWEIVNGDPDRVRAAVFYVLPVLVTVLLVFGIGAWRRNEAHKRDAELKQQMLSKGMSADEIVRVLTAKTDPRLNETVPYVKKQPRPS